MAETHDHTDGLLPVALYDTDEEARLAAKALVARGIGATVSRLVAPAAGAPGVEGADEASVPPGEFQTMVLPADLARASEILGIDAPEWAAQIGLDGEIHKPPRSPVRTILIVWAILMIVIPGIAFYIAYNYTGS